MIFSVCEMANIVPSVEQPPVPQHERHATEWVEDLSLSISRDTSEAAAFDVCAGAEDTIDIDGRSNCSNLNRAKSGSLNLQITKSPVTHQPTPSSDVLGAHAVPARRIANSHDTFDALDEQPKLQLGRPIQVPSRTFQNFSPAERANIGGQMDVVLVVIADEILMQSVGSTRNQ